MPVIATGQCAPVVQALLDDGPFAGGAYDETMEIDLKAIGDGIVVDLRGQATGSHQRSPSSPLRSAT